MTAPRADLGDSIQKAFRNVDDILNDLDMELTDETVVRFGFLDITVSRSPRILCFR